ncbi:MAG: STAS domain-containing protein [Candidatus Viridilinea halotolerans]|uniref:STAS domain-containing protein n=1 Tax=Candidatus Viridilinea halotolerans TaxID=2491704 RepID=A0A426U6Y3_9CHLR|nr:MAG: STAS domain-containing protein [Candidatus Viridilinea halotolerans]
MTTQHANVGNAYGPFFTTVQYVAIGFGVVEVGGAFFFNSPALAVCGILTALIGAAFALARWLLYRDHLLTALFTAIIAIGLSPIFYMIVVPELLAAFMLFPILAIGIAMLDRSLQLYFGTVLCSALVTVFLVGLSIIPHPLPPAPAGIMFFLQFTTPVTVVILCGMLFAYTWSNLNRTLEASEAANQELQALRDSLEEQVAQRTADLATALQQVQNHAAEQERLLIENARQRATISELVVPILPVSQQTLVVPLVGTIDEERLATLRERSLRTLEQRAAKTLLLDLTGVEILDTFAATGILQLVQGARLLGSQVVLIGIRPEVAQTMVSLGIDLADTQTMADLQSALAVLR